MEQWEPIACCSWSFEGLLDMVGTKRGGGGGRGRMEKEENGEGGEKNGEGGEKVDCGSDHRYTVDHPRHSWQTRLCA